MFIDIYRERYIFIYVYVYTYIIWKREDCVVCS